MDLDGFQIFVFLLAILYSMICVLLCSITICQVGSYAYVHYDALISSCRLHVQL